MRLILLLIVAALVFKFAWLLAAVAVTANDEIDEAVADGDVVVPLQRLGSRKNSEAQRYVINRRLRAVLAPNARGCSPTFCYPV